MSPGKICRACCVLAILGPPTLLAASLQYQTTFGGHGSTTIAGVATDAAGNVYVAGSTNAFDLPVKNAHQPLNPGTAVVVSRDAGRTWAPLGVVPDFPFTGVEAPAANPKDPNLLIASGVYGVYRSTDAGGTWKAVVDLNVDRARVGYVDRVEWDPRNPSTVYVSSTSGVLKSTDSGASWVLLANGIQPGNCCTGAGLAADPFVAQRLVYTINERAYVSQDGGTSWNRLALPAAMRLPFVVLDPFVAGTWYAYDFQGAYRSEDAGATWTAIPLTANLFGWIVADPSTQGRLYASDTDGLFRSDDRGRSWKAIPFPDTAPKLSGLTAFQVQPGNPNWLVAGGVSADGVDHICLFSPDAGQTWQPMGAVREFDEFRFDPSQPNVLYAGGTPTADAFVAKLDPAGNIQFLTYLGGQGDDNVSGIALDGAGNIYLAGTTESVDFPGVTARLYPGLSPKLFVAKLDASGAPLQTTLFGGAGYASVSGFALDPNRNFLLAGYVRTALPPSGDAFLPFGAQGGAFAIKLAADGSRFLYSSALPGNAGAVASDPAGDFLIAGQFLDNRFPPDANGNGSANLLKFGPGGGLLQATLLAVAPVAIASDSSGNIYTAGNAVVANHAPVSPGASQTAIDTGCPMPVPYGYRDPTLYLTDVYVARWSPDWSSLQFATYLGGSCRDTVTDLAVAADGSVWVTGDTQSDPFPVRDPVFGPPPPNISRPFISHLDATGSSLLFSSYLAFGSSALVAPDAAGNVYVTENPPAGASYGLTPIVGTLAKISTAPAAYPAPQRVVDVFSRTNVPVSPQEIVAVEIPGFQPPQEINLGFQPAGGAPPQLAGVSVDFNGTPAPMLAVRNGEIVCVTPAALQGQTLAAVQVVNGASRSGMLYVDVMASTPAFYQVRNPDGKVNSRRDPAPPGSQVTFLLTGAGMPDPTPPDGAIATSAGLPSPPVSLSFNGSASVPAAVGAAAGVVIGMYAATATLPQAAGAITVNLYSSSTYPFPFVTPPIVVEVGAPPPLRSPGRPRR